MRVLWLTAVPPVRLGAGTRLFYSIMALAPGAEIDLIASIETSPQLEKAMTQARSVCRTVTIVPPRVSSRGRRRLLQVRAVCSHHPAQYWLRYSHAMQGCIDAAVRRNRYDVAILEQSFMGYYSLPANLPIVLAQHNVESEVLRRSGRLERSSVRRLYNVLEHAKYRSDERRVCRNADLIFAMSRQDRDVMLRWGGLPRCMVLPFGIDVTHFSPARDASQLERRGNVVFTGSMDYSPNVEAMLHFVDTIWPVVRARMPHAELTIVGSNPLPEIVRLGDRPDITVTGYVADTRAYLAAAEVIVVPLRIGGGIRVKIMEALAMGKAVVSTSLGCEGLHLEHGRDLLIADRPQDFAFRVIELLADPGRRADLGSNGRRAIEQLYDARIIARRERTAIGELLGAISQGHGPTARRSEQPSPNASIRA